MQNPEKPDVDDYEPAKIVQIAYRQMNEMYGMENPCHKNAVPTEIDANTLISVRRILQLPVFAVVTTTMTDMYNSVKQSNEVFTSIFTTTEEGLEKGAKLVEPVTHQIGNTFETPLKSIDNLICQGLDYLEEKVPCITGSSGQFLTNIGISIRSAMQSLTAFYINVVNSIRNITAPLPIEAAESGTEEDKSKTSKN